MKTTWEKIAWACAFVSIGLAFTVMWIAGVEDDPVRTLTKEVAVVPEVCLEALDSARAVFKVAEENGSVTIGYINLIDDALDAGFDTDIAAINRIAERVEKLTLKTQRLTDKLAASEFVTNAAECEAANGQT